MAWDAVPEPMVEYINPDFFFKSRADRWRHIAASPLGSIWLDSTFIEAFTDFDVTMPG